MPPRILNMDDLRFEKRTHGDAYQARVAWVGEAMKSRKLGFSIGVIAPGKRAFPYHAHHGNEEMFLILEGRGSVRIAGETHPIRQGDFISLPPGPDSAHQLINDSPEPLRYLAVSTMEVPEVVEYPDSGKVGVLTGAQAGHAAPPGSIRQWLRLADAVDYWDGEDD